MAERRNLSVGDSVLIQFDPHDICVVPGMLEYNGLETEISKVHKSKSSGGKQFRCQYECKGVESRYGVPFIFTRDMLFDAGEGCYE